MNLELNEEQQLWRQTVHKFIAKEIKPLSAALDKKGEFNSQAVKPMAALGLLGLNIESEYGGADLDSLSAAITLEELGWGCAGTALSVAAHNALCAAPISLFGSAAQKNHWLPILANGTKGLGALALTEPGAGSDLQGGVRTRAVLQGDSWVLNGSKAWITNANHAPVIVVLARTEVDGDFQGLSLFLVPHNTEGMEILRAEEKMGVRASPTHGISFNTTKIPADNILGVKGEGLHQALEVLDGGRIGIAALAVGIARAAYEEAVRYANERRTFGAALGSHQAVQFMIADAITSIEAARLMVFQAAWKKDQGVPFTKEASMAKLFATEMAESVTRNAIQIHGGYGYSTEFNLERHYRDARLMTIGEGTSEVQRMVIARESMNLNHPD